MTAIWLYRALIAPSTIRTRWNDMHFFQAHPNTRIIQLPLGFLIGICNILKKHRKGEGKKRDDRRAPYSLTPLWNYEHQAPTPP